MEYQKLRIISDTGEDSTFQATPLYNEQFMEVFKTLQVNRDDCIELINKETLSLKADMLKSSFAVVDMFYNMNKEFNEKIDTEKKTIAAVLHDKVVSLEDQIKLKVQDSILFTENSIESLRSSTQYSINRLMEDLSGKSLEILKLQEEKDVLELTDKNALEIIQILRLNIVSLQEQTVILQEQINNLKETKVDIKKPWYKRVFSR